jgi:hypothetical protein
MEVAMTLDDLRATLTEWLTELHPWSPESNQDCNNYILTDEEFMRYRGITREPREELHVLLFTERHAYHIVASLRDGVAAYFGATASTTFYRTGETWTRGNDLPDGPFSREMWDVILRAILRYEMRSMTADAIKQIKGIPRGTPCDGIPKV